MKPVALIMLASGTSSRFRTSDKLLAPLGDGPLAMKAASLCRDRLGIVRIAVLPPDHAERRSVFENSGWKIVINPTPRTGMASSIRTGVEAARREGAEAVLISLADMPFVTCNHIDALLDAIGEREAVMSDCIGQLMPPAAFRAECFDELIALSGDRGARSVFTRRRNTATIPLDVYSARDVDTVEMLERLQEELINND